MLNFTFRNPVKVIFGAGSIAQITPEIPAGSRVLLTYGGGSVKTNGTLAEVQAALHGFSVFEFGGIEPNPQFETLMRAVELVRAQGIDFILAVGGGSVIDGSKFIAAAACYDGDALTLLHKFGRPIQRAIPLGAVLTLAATGSEMNNGGVITHAAAHAKLFFANDAVFPRFAVLDPTKTYTLPPRQISNGIVDSFVHVVEQYLTYPVGAKVQDRFAEGLLLTLIEDGAQILAEPENYTLRANLMWTATLALNGLIGAGVPQDWATHMIGHELTAAYGLDHAQTLAVVLPAMLTVRKEAKRAKLLQYAERVWQLTAGSEDERIDQAIARTREFFHSLQMKTTLSAYGLDASAIPHIIEQLTAHGMVKLGEKRDVTPGIAEQVLKLCL